MTERMIETNGVQICAESFGDPKNPGVLLVMGATASMVWWHDDFCAALAARGFFVVRYDHRDTGKSTCNPPGELTYSVNELVEDAFGVLDAYGLERASFVGMSLGGMLAQVAALKQPERVTSIAAIASGIFDDRPDLPGMDEALLAYHSAAAEVDWTDEESVRRYLLGGWRLLNGSHHPFDEARAHAQATAEFRRARNLPSMFNHAQLAGAEDQYGRTGELTVPVLVIHGTEDRVLPLPHAVALAETAPNAKLVTLHGRGHEVHANDWPQMIDELTDHIRRALAS